MEPINHKPLILASKSPRRKELLESIGLHITIAPSNVNEDSVGFKQPYEFAEELSFLKADSISTSYPDVWIIGADTIVVVKGEILGKPKSKSHARDMLSKLNNTEHSVFTGFCLVHRRKNMIIKKSVETKVYFKDLTSREILWYAESDEPYDKAGAYGIQGIGSFLVKKISGSYTNVVGLPVCEVFDVLKDLDIINI